MNPQDAKYAEPGTGTGADGGRFTGTVIVDVSAYVDHLGSLTHEGQTEMWMGLSGAGGLPVRLMLGKVRSARSVTSMSAALYAAYDCEQVEVCGDDPGCVAAIVRWLRSHVPDPASLPAA